MLVSENCSSPALILGSEHVANAKLPLQESKGDSMLSPHQPVSKRGTGFGHYETLAWHWLLHSRNSLPLRQGSFMKTGEDMPNNFFFFSLQVSILEKSTSGGEVQRP